MIVELRVTDESVVGIVWHRAVTLLLVVLMQRQAKPLLLSAHEVINSFWSL